MDALMLALRLGCERWQPGRSRHLGERTHARVRARAANQGRSVDAEVRAILDAAVDLPEEDFLPALHAAMSEDGRLDRPSVPRTGIARLVHLT